MKKKKRKHPKPGSSTEDPPQQQDTAVGGKKVKMTPPPTTQPQPEASEKADRKKEFQPFDYSKANYKQFEGRCDNFTLHS